MTPAARQATLDDVPLLVQLMAEFYAEAALALDRREARDAFVDDLYVRPRFRRQGVGRLALATLFAECQQRGVRAVHLEVGRDNHEAKALYARFGFRDNERQLLTVRLPRDASTAQLLVEPSP